jgi:integrase
LNPSLLPLQFPSLEHFDARVKDILRQVGEAEDSSPATARWLRGAYRAFRQYLEVISGTTRFIGGNLQLQVRLAEEWPAFLRSRNVARPTVNSYWRGMRGICARLGRQDGVVNPFLFVHTPHPGDPSLRFLTQDAAERILQFVQNDAGQPRDLRIRNLAIIAMMLLAGVRRGELLRVEVKDVDLTDRIIRIVKGKGRHGGKKRSIPMTDQLFTILQRYADWRATVAVACAEFFLGTWCEGPLSEMTLRRIFRRISSRTGIHVSPHMLRHTFCTLLSKAGVSDRLAKEAMGHADYATLQRYQHVYEGELASEMSKLRLDISL